MRRRERFWRRYSEADWFAHLLLSTFIVAAINFLDIISIMAERTAHAREAARYGIFVCYFGPPPPFYPRFIVVVALLIATLGAFKKTAWSRFVASVGSAVALLAYVFWWLDSYQRLRNFEDLAGIRALIHPEVNQFVYLYHGTPPDLAVALSTAVCLVLTLDRLFDGEQKLDHASQGL